MAPFGYQEGTRWRFFSGGALVIDPDARGLEDVFRDVPPSDVECKGGMLLALQVHTSSGAINYSILESYYEPQVEIRNDVL